MGCFTKKRKNGQCPSSVAGITVPELTCFRPGSSVRSKESAFGAVEIFPLSAQRHRLPKIQ